MLLLQGNGVSKGVACAPLYFYQRPADIMKEHRDDLNAERSRLDEAREAAAAQLAALAEKAREEAGDDAALLFETHAMFLDDEDYTASILSTLEEESCNAEYAVWAAGEAFAEMFASMDDEYMQARAADIRDVSRRLADVLTGTVRGIDSDVPVILAADDLAPSETVQLDKSKILGFLTRGGSATGHTAILARTMGIPAICGIGDALKDDFSGQLCIVDGTSGEAIVDPDAARLDEYEKKAREQRAHKELLETLKGKDDVTADGQKIDIYCNIGSPADVEAVLANDGHGIGLFRTEFLYLSAGDYPDEETLFNAYKTVAEAMNGKRVVIRTLDIGADKQAAYFGLPHEENPAMGMRAVRICLNRPELFRTQLRALYRASAYGKVAIMFPMIASVWEVEECLRACERVKKELSDENIPYAPDVETGIMIETPASVFIADELAQLVDFFSVGTNDLTQYTLACDRQNNNLGRFFDPHHPAVLRALKIAADAAHRCGIWIGICGELGADISLLPDFLAIGIDELSVTPSSVLPLRDAVRKFSRAAPDGK